MVHDRGRERLKAPYKGLRKAMLLGASAISLKRNDCLLVGFPKVGSTWVRYFLFSLLSQNDACGKTGDIDRNLDLMNRLMPEFGHPSFFHPWQFKDTPRIVKTHHSYNISFRKRKAVLLIRDPRDVVVSYFHHLQARKDSHFNGNVQDVLRHKKLGLRGFLSHYESWKDHVGLILRYEDLGGEPVRGFERLLDHFSIEHDRGQVRKAVSESSFEVMASVEERSPELKSKFRKTGNFVRRGRPGEWREYFDEDDMNYANRLLEQYNFEFYLQ